MIYCAIKPEVEPQSRMHGVAAPTVKLQYNGEGSLATLHWWMSFSTPIPPQIAQPEGKSNLSIHHSLKPKSRLRLLTDSGQDKKQWATEVCLRLGGGCFKSLAAFQDFNTSLEIHKGVKSTLATNYSLINSVESCADGRRFFTGQGEGGSGGAGKVQRIVNSVWTVSREKKKSFQDVLAHIRCVFASTSCSLPSMRPFPAANAQVFGHIPTMLSPYSY